MPDFDEPIDPGQAQDPAMADTPRETGPEDLPPETPDDDSQPVDDGEQQAALPPEEDAEPDEYAGPTELEVVGDNRQLQVFALRVDYEPGETPVGEAWQDETGQVHGSGMIAVMLFELSSRQRYINASIARDLSPLAVMQKRLARANLFRTELLEGDNESE